MNDVSIIIPARFASTRFPGKPLALINGKAMILHVCEGCAPAFGKDKVYVVTDDARIKAVVESSGFNVIMTTKEQVFHTGSDRVSYASRFVDSEYIINVQGDEPLVQAEDIRLVYAELLLRREYGTIKETTHKIVNCCKVEIIKETSASIDGVTWDITNEFENTNTIKVIVDELDNLIYMSRHPIPTYTEVCYTKTPQRVYKKQVCIYGFKKHDLQSKYGEHRHTSLVEESEKIEILRIIDYKDFDEIVKMIEVKNEYQSVDCPEDIEKVEKVLNGK